jgi:hypothetical protein
MKQAYVLDGSQLYSSASDNVCYHLHYSLRWNAICELHIGITVAMYNTYMKNGCVRKVRRRGQQKLQDITVPNRKKPFIQLYNKLR